MRTCSSLNSKAFGGGVFDLSLTGFDDAEISQLLDENAQVTEDGFDVEAELEQPTISQMGDIWILGRHRLMCGDSTVQEQFDKLMDGAQADLVVTDPPYNVNYGEKAEMLEKYLGKGHRNTSKIANDNMDNASFTLFMSKVYQTAFNIMRPGAAIYVFHAENTGHIFRQELLNAGLKLAQCLIWEKNSFVKGRQDYQWKHEPCLYGWKEGAAHYFLDDRCQDTILKVDDVDIEAMKKAELVEYVKELRTQLNERTSILYEDKPTTNDLHPTMKPVKLVGRLITNSSKRKWNVVDLFGGSGTTLIASEQLERNAFLMEYEPKYCDVMAKRYIELVGKDDEVFLERDGVRIPYKEVCKL